VVVELGEANVLKGQVLQTINRISDRCPALAHFIQQILDKCAIHQRFSFSVAA
jgi:hypothetical protein